MAGETTQQLGLNAVASVNATEDSLSVKKQTVKEQTAKEKAIAS